MTFFVLLLGSALLMPHALVELRTVGTQHTEWVNDHPCGTTFAVPKAASTADCPRSFCITVPSDLLVCSCVSSGHGEASAQLVIKSKNSELQRWPTEFVWPSNTDVFLVTLADLDADGRDELLVATLNSITNGMAVESWSVCAVNGADLASPPSCVQVDDYGSMGYPTQSPQEKGCLLLESHWRSGSEAGRGEGLYLVGRWLRYDGRGFLPEGSRPLLAHRFLYSFERARWKARAAEPPSPLAWYRDDVVRVVTCPDRLCG